MPSGGLQVRRANQQLAREEQLKAVIKPEERIIAEVYLTDGKFSNKKTAAIVGCTSDKVNEVVKLPAVKDYMNWLLDLRGFKVKAIRNDLLKELVSCAKANIADVIETTTTDDGWAILKVKEIDKLPREVQSAIKSIRVTNVVDKEGNQKQNVEITMHDKIRSAEVLGKWTGMELEAKKEENEIEAGEPMQLVGFNIVAPKRVEAVEVIDFDPIEDAPINQETK